MIAGSLFENTDLPLATRFLAICLISQAKTGLAALALKRQLGVSYPTAWLLRHKINRVMTQRETRHRLGGDIEIDDACLGAFAGRFDRRFDLHDLVARLIVDVARGAPTCEFLVRVPAETRF